MKKIKTFFLSIVMAAAVAVSSAAAPVSAYAAETEDGDPGASTPEKEAAADSSLGGSLRKAAAVQTKPATGYGIDVSYWQGTIDWQKVKNEGVSFAFIRVAYRSTGSSGKMYTDTKAIDNIKGAQAAGIKIGVYCFSTAISEDEALEEAKYTLDIIKDYKIDLPVVYDHEGYNISSYRNYSKNASSSSNIQKRTDRALVFLQYVESQGYDGMVYSSAGHMAGSAYWDMSRLENYYGIWMAQYYYKNSSKNEMYHDFDSLVAKPSWYTGQYIYWQGSDQGQLDGIDGYVDMDIEYGPYTNNTVNTANKTGWETDSKGKYYLRNSVRVTGLQTIGKNKYYFDENGYLQYGEHKIGKYYYYFKSGSGKMAVERWKTYTDSSGKKYKVYYGKKGRRLTGSQKIGSYKYYFNKKTGAMVKSAWKTFTNKKGVKYKVYYNKKGRRLTGQHKVGKYYYYFSSGSGAMAKNKWKTLTDKYGNKYKVYYNKKGHRVSGTVKIKGVRYTFNKKTGALIG